MGFHLCVDTVPYARQSHSRILRESPDCRKLIFNDTEYGFLTESMARITLTDKYLRNSIYRSERIMGYSRVWMLRRENLLPRSQMRSC